MPALFGSNGPEAFIQIHISVTVLCKQFLRSQPIDGADDYNK
jgi:hypothetical protein